MKKTNKYLEKTQVTEYKDYSAKANELLPLKKGELFVQRKFDGEDLILIVMRKVNAFEALGIGDDEEIVDYDIEDLADGNVHFFTSKDK